ncbi:hypothetical protein PybrP1_011775 [[Pythium] brassicae (nom. inval.)]|nr:hypothetical protein PybrP1_011775 [[Pythium] brassicae (nom. inval.)]
MTLAPIARSRSTSALSDRCTAVGDGVRRDALLCSICFDILCFPVTLPCGHNFDRGCILAAWECDDVATQQQQQQHQHQPPLQRVPPFLTGFDFEDDVDDAELARELAAPPAPPQRSQTRLCALCRHDSGICDVNELQVNLLLKDVIAKLYPLETENAATLEKQQAAARASGSGAAGGGALNGRNSSGARFSFRAISSFVYVYAASVTDPPGFVLAVLLLLGLIALAYNPQHVLASNASATALSLVDVFDHVLSGFSLLVREFSCTLDLLDQLTPWARVFSFVV